MAIVATVPEDEATGDVAALYAEDVKDEGHVLSHTKVMALNPEAEAAFEQLIRATYPSLGKRGYELVTLAAAKGARSKHCRLAHGGRSLGLFDEAQLIRIALDHRDAGLTDAEVAMMTFAEKVSTASHTMTDADSESLRDAGFSDRQIVDIALVAAARNYYSRAVQALAIDVDMPKSVSPALAAALTDGL